MAMIDDDKDDSEKIAKMSVLAKNIKRAMADAGEWSESKVSEMAGLSRGSIREICGPDRYKEPGILRVIKIAGVLGVSVARLIDGIEPPNLREREPAADRNRVKEAIGMILDIERNGPNCLTKQQMYEIADILMDTPPGPLDNSAVIPILMRAFSARRK